jgi:hypothetical protein
MSNSWARKRIAYLRTIEYRWTEREEIEYFTLVRELRQEGEE